MLYKKHSLHIGVAFLLLSLSFSASAITVVFDVSAQRSIASYSGGLQWTAVGSYNFQVAIDLDQNQYSFSDVIPQNFESFIDYYREASVDINSFSGDNFDEVNSLRQAANISTNAVTATGAFFSTLRNFQ